MPEHELTHVTLCFYIYIKDGGKTKIQCFILELFIHSSEYNFTPEYNKYTTNTHTHNNNNQIRKKQSNFCS